MREIINISLPKSLSDEVKIEVKKGSFASTSEFFRHLLRVWKEDSLYRELEKSRKELSQGKAKKLRSLKDLR
jgi:Arc/MetJ-type ribon-helix-helix transcriptional regulator